MSKDVLNDRHQCSKDRRLRVVVALDFLLQRETISRALSLLRPDWLVFQIPPEDVERALSQHCPDVVICTTISEVVEQRAPMWILLYPVEPDTCVVSIHGEQYEIPNLTLGSVVETIDQAHN